MDRSEQTSSAPEKGVGNFDLIVIGASAGGGLAIRSVLAGLPETLSLTIVLMLHLPPEATLPSFVQHAYEVEWIDRESRIGEHKVLVAPPRSFVELLPDGSFTLSACPGGAVERPIDRLFDSVARSFGPRAIGVILSGMGKDGALGARELRLSGGRVIVQSPATSEYSAMPVAAITTGAPDMVVPVEDVGQVIGEIILGTPRPRTRSELRAIARVFGEVGEIAGLARELDWSQTPLGSAVSWPDELRMSVRTAIDSPQATAIWWGSELIQIYNDGWRVLFGSKHPGALGRPARDSWLEVWTDVLAPIVKGVMARGEAVSREDFSMMIDRRGFLEEVFISFSYSPIRDAGGRVLGVQTTGWETTRNVVAERRTRFLHALGLRLAPALTRNEACERAAAALANAPADVPFALLYVLDSASQQATLAGAAGLEAGTQAAPYVISADQPESKGWPMAAAMAASIPGREQRYVVDALAERFPGLMAPIAAPRGSQTARRALMIPLGTAARERPLALLILGLSPHRPQDEAHANFIDLVIQQVSAGIGDALAKELERERVERLAEIDRTKTEFFSNMSHEFRTPLTLMLAPLDVLLQQRSSLPAQVSESVDVAVRNARRLLRLVNSLLDFSAIDTRRERVAVAATDIATLTTDIASTFRSAIEAAGLTLRVEVDADLPSVPVDAESWEMIVSNLLSNALKFTFEGSILVRLRAMRLHVELEVVDTGVGIPTQELPNVFKRFHRVRGARARTAEGAGIGLAIVQDLVQRMGGQLTVHSREGLGTRFTTWIPLRSRLNPAQRSTERAGKPAVAALLADEAARWLHQDAALQDQDLVEPSATAQRKRGRLLVVDDNADLREHLRRLLTAQWDVDVAADGQAALKLAQQRRPDLVVADVMMPQMDGLSLLRAIRGDEALRDTPVLLVTAFAGEEAALEGLKAGADGYIAKPFSARELLARVEGQIELARTRRRTQEINAFLVRFSDAARGLREPRLVAAMACRMVAEHLNSEQVDWLRMDASGEHVVEASFVAQGVPASEGGSPLTECEPFRSAYERGQSLVVGDTQADLHLSAATKQALLEIGAGAAVCIPVMADGRLRGLLSVTQRTPRRWLPEMVALVEGVAARCWAEIERARSGAALQLALEHKSVLLTELQYRVRGILAVIRFINTRTAEGAKSVQDHAALMSGRLMTLARVQDLLAKGVEVGVHLHTLVSEEFSAQDQDLNKLHLEGIDVVLSPKAAEVLIMVIHELVINASQHGALSSSSGYVEVHWQVVDRNGSPWLSLEWREHAGPAPGSSLRRGFGTEMIERRIAYELGGSGRLQFADDGARCLIDFPIKAGASILETVAPAEPSFG